VGLRAPHYRQFLEQHPRVDWLEVHTENYISPGGWDRHVLFALREHYPISLHGVGLAIGSAHGFSLAHLQQVAHLVRELQPCLVSEHLCWGAVADWHSNDLLPMPLAWQSFQLLCDRIDQVQNCLQRPILLENVSTYLRFSADQLSEAEFLVALARRTGCQILLDVNNLFVNQCNHAESALAALAAVPGELVGEIHLAGHLLTPDAVVDHHGAPVAEAVWELYRSALQRLGPIPTLIEWDTDIPPLPQLLAEADIARLWWQHAGSDGRTELPHLNIGAAAPIALPEPDLAGVQAGFADGMLAATRPQLPWFRGEMEYSSARFARYRANLQVTWEKVMAAAFPVLQQQVGDEFFAALARAYGHAHPSQSGDLNQFGAFFADFLRDFPHVASYPWFPDLARLEWAWHRACYAADGRALSAQELADWAPEQLEQAHFQLQPGLALIASDWAIVALWLAHQPDSGVDYPDPIVNPCHAMVCRPRWRPEVIAIDAASHAALCTLQQGGSFGTALDAALALDSTFDVSRCLSQWLATGVLQAA
jgi:uncharacterized protein (UPF0276 family)